METEQWPYKVDYGKENEISADVLILGGERKRVPGWPSLIKGR